MEYLGAWGTLIHEKNMKSKISWHCPSNKMTSGGMKDFQRPQQAYKYYTNRSRTCENTGCEDQL
jgi:hypothetical protein